MALEGYRLNGTTFKPGDVIELLSYWRVLRTVENQDDWNTFVHVLDEQSQVVGGIDVLACPPTGWYPGDIMVQVHRFALSPKALAGQEVYLEIGVYRRTTNARLPVLVGDEVVGDRVLLDLLTIE